MLQIQDVHKRFGNVDALKGVSLTVRSGEILALLGPNGAGKTTLIKVILGLLLPDKGKVLFVGETGERPPRGHEFGVLLEGSRNLYMNLSLLENALYFGGIRGLAPGFVQPRFKEWLGRFGLSDRLHASLATLSRGMQQKGALALALTLEPRLLLLDEPTLGLDPVSRREFEEILLELKAGGWGILLTSHDLKTVERVSDRVAFIHKGSLVKKGRTRTLLSERSGEGYVIKLGEHYGKQVAQLDPRFVLETSDQVVFLGSWEELKPFLSELEGEVLEISRGAPSLETLFIDLVGKERADQTPTTT